MNKYLLFIATVAIFFAGLVFCPEAVADPYRVNAPRGLNVRAEASQSAPVIGKLPEGSTVQALTIQGGWAHIKYNGKDAYVSASYLVRPSAYENSGSSSSSPAKKSRDLTSWIFSSEGEAGWFTALKWLFIIGLVIFLFKVGMSIIGAMIGAGLLTGGCALAIAFIVKWIGWIESDTMWTIGKWGFYIGAIYGLLDSFIHFREILADASSSGSGTSPSGGGSGLKSYSVTLDGKEYILTQRFTTSESDYIDQYGNPWSCDSSGFHPE